MRNVYLAYLSLLWSMGCAASTVETTGSEQDSETSSQTIGANTCDEEYFVDANATWQSAGADRFQFTYAGQLDPSHNEVVTVPIQGANDFKRFVSISINETDDEDGSNFFTHFFGSNLEITASMTCRAGDVVYSPELDCQGKTCEFGVGIGPVWGLYASMGPIGLSCDGELTLKIAPYGLNGSIEQCVPYFVQVDLRNVVDVGAE